MKSVLIISPHYPPSNLAAVHRARLFAQHLPAFGWDPIILTVHEQHYEEDPDWKLVQLLPPEQKIFKVNAYPLTKPRMIGDLGLRAFFQLRRKALEIIRDKNIDFVYIPIPSFYVSMIGPYLHRKTGVPYGIDYIDPWVHEFPGSEKVFSRHWWSTQLAKWLEPIAVRHASLITGVAEGYFQGVLERNPKLHERAITGAMPYGAEVADHQIVSDNDLQPYLFPAERKKFRFVYAGAMLPKAYIILQKVFESISDHPHIFNDLEIHFIGTGSHPNDDTSFTIRPMAERYGLWESIIFEYPKRIPYLDVLIHLKWADAIFVLGSTEPHYTPSKVFQAVLSRKPIFAMLHEKSSAKKVLQGTGAGWILDFDEKNVEVRIAEEFVTYYTEFRQFAHHFRLEELQMKAFEDYSAHHITGKLAELLNTIVDADSNASHFNAIFLK